MADKMRVPRAVRAIWGAGLVLLNAFMVVYVVGFISLFAGTMSGLGESGFAGTLLADERAFSALFAVVGLAVFLSFAYIALSIAHVFAWSDLPSDRKFVWAAVLFGGAQPAALIYWYLHVWRRARPPAAKPKTPRQIPRPLVALLGLLSVLPIAYMAGFFVVVGAGVASSGGGNGDLPWILGVLPIAHVSIIVLSWALIAVFLVDVFHNPRLEGNARILWAAVIAFAGFVGWPVYWYINMWRPAPLPAEPSVAGAWHSE